MKTLPIQDRLENINRSFVSVMEINGIPIDPSYKARVHENSIELVLFDKQDKMVFGASINLYFYNRYDQPSKLEINVGSMGSFDLSCEASIPKYLAVATLIKNFSMLETLVESATVLYTQACTEHFSSSKK